MNLAIGTLVFAGFLTIVLGVASKLMGISLLAPYIEAASNYFVIGIACFVMALVIDKFEKS